MSAQPPRAGSGAGGAARVTYDIVISTIGNLVVAALAGALGYIGGGMTSQQALLLTLAVFVALLLASFAWRYIAGSFKQDSSSRSAYFAYLAVVAAAIVWILLAMRSLEELAPPSSTPVLLTPEPGNRLIVQQDFEGTHEGWSRAALERLSDDGTQIVDQSFDLMKSALTSDKALTGRHSLRVSAMADSPGVYKGILYYPQDLLAHGITMYLFAPEQDGMSIDYAQICLPSQGWVCSHGTVPSPEVWTPLVIDLSDEYDDKRVYEQLIGEAAIQWRFRTDRPGAFELYFDAGQILNAGE